MNAIKDKNVWITLGISAFAAVLISVICAFGEKFIFTLKDAVLPQDATLTWQKAAILIAVGATIGVLTEKFSLKRVAPYIIYFIAIWFCASVAVNKIFEMSLMFVPVTLILSLTALAVHVKKLWQIDTEFTEKLLSLIHI